MALFYHLIDHWTHRSPSIPHLSIRGMTEGITLLILAVQTGLIELKVIHRAFLLSIILFIVVASILQSMLEIADPIVLALGASRDKYITMKVEVMYYASGRCNSVFWLFYNHPLPTGVYGSISVRLACACSCWCSRPTCPTWYVSSFTWTFGCLSSSPPAFWPHYRYSKTRHHKAFSTALLFHCFSTFDHCVCVWCLLQHHWHCILKAWRSS